EHYAACNSFFYWYWWGYGQPYRAYTFTERPVYRPDQLIHFKTILRRYDKGSSENLPEKRLTVQVYNPRGEVVELRELKTNEEGTVSGDLRLPEDTPLGLYRIVSTVDGRPLTGDAEARFRVEEYRKPEFEVTVSAERPDYRIGQSIDVRIDARYYFGEPVAEARIAATVYRTRHRKYFRWPTPWPWYFEDHTMALGAARLGKAILPPGDYRWREHERELVGRFDLTTDDSGAAILRSRRRPALRRRSRGHRCVPPSYHRQRQRQGHSRAVLHQRQAAALRLPTRRHRAPRHRSQGAQRRSHRV
ncbi:MAG: MG2 domain-containing protein, partial [Planctomycetota bacterium]